MTIASAITLAAAEGAHDPIAVMMATLPAFFVSAAIFTVLGLMTLSHRHVANRHAPKAEQYAARTRGASEAGR